MTEFNKLCKQFEQMDALTYTAILAEKSLKIVPALSAITENDVDGVALFAGFIVGAVVADGDLSVEEFAITFPLFKAFFGDEISYEACNYIVRSMRSESKQLNKYVDYMVDAFGQLSEELKDDIIIVCLMICAIDGKVSLKEKQWIKRLIK